MAPTQYNSNGIENNNATNINHNTVVDNSGFEEVASSSRSKASTTSVALPSSILANAQSPELRMYLAGQVARALAIYRIDEVIIFSEHQSNYNVHNHHRQQQQPKQQINPSEMTKFFAMVLQYLETPQYLRKYLFPMSSELRLVGLLNPLALPTHHSRSEHPRYREGVFVSSHKQQHHQNKQKNQSPPTKYVDVGLDRLVEVDKQYPFGTRATIDLSLSGAGPSYSRAPGKYLFGRIVQLFSSTSASAKTNHLNDVYSGYKVRTAASLSGIFSGSSVAKSGYDLTIGTSEKGTHISKSGKPTNSFALPDFSHLLIVFGGVHGLERSVVGDETLEELGIIIRPQQNQNNDSNEDAHSNGNGNLTHGNVFSSEVGSNVGDLFDFYLNTCPLQGSRTIRTEEAILLSLAALQPFLNAVDS